MCTTTFLVVFCVILRRAPVRAFAFNEWASLLFPDLQPIANKVPRQADMMNALSSELHNWEMIILSLQVPMSRVQSIKSENSSDYMRMAAGLNTWISTRCYKPTTWQGLINVLSENGKEEAVSRVEQRMRAKYNDYIGRN